MVNKSASIITIYPSLKLVLLIKIIWSETNKY
jgi:hypothetical protein